MASPRSPVAAPAAVAPEWDYTVHAEWYRFRPNYARAALSELVDRVEARRTDFRAADVGAGTGNVSILLIAERVRSIVAVEPNAAMRAYGCAATRGTPVAWVAGVAEALPLAGASVDWVAMGSSFNTTDRPRALAEAARVLRPGGWFTCLWNHRDLDGDPVQRRVEAIIRRHVPEYAHGTRREDQSATIAACGAFAAAERLAVEHVVEQRLDDYLAAWRSVRNRHWDLRTPAGRARFAAICDDIRTALGPGARFAVRYTTRAWSARLRSR